MNGTPPPVTAPPARPSLRIAVLGADYPARRDLVEAIQRDFAGSAIERTLCIDADAPLQRWAHARADTGGKNESADSGLVAATVQHRTDFQATLLISADGPEPVAADRLLRHALMHGGVSFQVLHGSVTTLRAQQARKALQPLLAPRRPAATPPPSTRDANLSAEGVSSVMRLRAWGCEKCSDPECEHQLFQRLLASR